MTKTKVFELRNKNLYLEDYRVFLDNIFINKSVEAPTEIKYVLSPIRLEMFTLGTRFKIELRNEKKDRLAIVINSYFNIDFNNKFGLYNEIADSIWNNHFQSLLEIIVSRWASGETIKIGRYELDQVKISKTYGINSKTVSIDYCNTLITERRDA